MDKKMKFSSKRVVLFTTLLLFLFLLNQVLPGSEVDKDKGAEIDRFMSFYYSSGQLNAAVLVAEGGKIIYKKAFGLADMEKQIPNETDSLFHIYSITKQFTAVLIMRLVEDGKLKLDGRISDYLPYYRKDIGEKVTIHHLLTHSHGIPDLELGELPAEISAPVEEFVKKYLSKDLEFEPGSEYKYSGYTGYMLLGVIIEKVSGKSYEEVLRQKIINPLGLEHTGMIDFNKKLEKQVVAYSRIDPFESKKLTEGFVDVHFNGANSMYSTVDDLYRWNQALASGKLLSKESMDLVFKKYIKTPDEENYAGYGWLIKERFGGLPETIHWGVGGNRVWLFHIVEKNHLILIVGNLDYKKINVPLQIISQAIQILYEMPYMPITRHYCFIELYRVLNKEGIEAAVKHYRYLRKNFADKYFFQELEFNYLGDKLFKTNRYKEAIEIYKLALEINPQSWEAYNNLGVSYSMLENKALALKYFKKSLEVNQQDTFKAKRMHQSVIKKMKALNSKKDTNGDK